VQVYFAGLAERAIRARLSRYRIRHITGDIWHVPLVHVPSLSGSVPFRIELLIPVSVMVLEVVAGVFAAVDAVRARIEVVLVAGS
jgi:hypothetical protein